MTSRARRLLVAGAIDSVGLAFGWAVFNLVAVYKHGLAVTALLNAAMFIGVALAAPAAARLTARCNGQRTLRLTAAVEGALRVATLVLLYVGAPLLLLLGLVLVMNVAAWTGFAAMRVEVAAVDARTTAMTRYLSLTLALEAAGVAVAAFVPISGHGSMSMAWLVLAAFVYGGSLVPTVLVAAGSTVGTRTAQVTRASKRDRRILLSGAVVMVVASGPTLLFVALAARLHGRESVAGAAIAFCIGSLVAPVLTSRLERLHLAGSASWPFWCLGMVAGWAAAPWSLAGLWLAQLLSGLCLTGFQGTMDHALTRGHADGDATAVLARGSAARALGSSVAVRLVPAVAAGGSLAAFAGVGGAVALAVGILLAALVRDDPNGVQVGHLGPARTGRNLESVG